MHVIDARLVYTRDLGADTYIVGLSSWPIGKEALPGQFVQVRFPGSKTILLPRAFSVLAGGDYCMQGGEADIELLVRIVGEGTRRLARGVPGETFQVTGPTGKAFEVPDDARRVIVAAGGVGVAPLYFLAAHLGRVRSDVELLFLYGAPTALQLAARELVDSLGVERVYTTEDGSFGRRGLVTEPLAELLREGGLARTLVCACGPAPMLRAVAELARDAGVRCLVSLENYLACGTGVCQGCVVNVGTLEAPQYRRVCREGPVFDASRVNIVELAARS